MRESIGTAWIMTIVITFIVLFSGYLAFSINYSKSFRVKDGIIERIHKHNGFESDGSTLKDIDDYIAQINYNAKGDCLKSCKEMGDSAQCAGVNGTQFERIDVSSTKKNATYNYCIFKVKNKVVGEPGKTSDPSTAYYKVVVFFSLQIGNISLFSNFRTPGETSTIYYPKDAIFE